MQIERKMAKGFNDIKPGDTLTILIPNGKSLRHGKIIQEYKRVSGRAVIVTRENRYDLSSPISHVALNLGGRFGTPGVATESNFVGFGRIK